MKRLKWVRRVWVILLFPAFLFGSGGCGYYHYSGSLQPMPEQSVSMQTDRAGVITHRENDLLIQLRAVSADELNQQFVTHSANGPESTNPYTFGDTRFWDGEQQRDRFTVYHLKVVNEGFPKVKIDPARVVMPQTGAASIGVSVYNSLIRITARMRPASVAMNTPVTKNAWTCCGARCTRTRKYSTDRQSRDILSSLHCIRMSVPSQCVSSMQCCGSIIAMNHSKPLS